MAKTMACEAGRLVRDIAARFKAAGLDTPMLDARLLVRHVSGLDDAALIANPDTVLIDEQCDALGKLATCRITGEPVSRLLGWREFYGRRFKITPATLDPRPDTEILVEAALALLTPVKRPHILDLGTGTGAIIITLLAERADAAGVATDLSEHALKVAQTNADALGVSDRLNLRTSDWFENVSGRFDLIVSNPPYIPSHEIAGLAREVREHDPAMSLDGGPDGLEPYKVIFDNAQQFLQHGGKLVLEFGKGQHDQITQLAAGSAFDLLPGGNGLVKDLSGIIRCAGFARR